jgi:hypothetical protein
MVYAVEVDMFAETMDVGLELDQITRYVTSFLIRLRTKK